MIINNNVPLRSQSFFCYFFLRPHQVTRHYSCWPADICPAPLSSLPAPLPVLACPVGRLALGSCPGLGCQWCRVSALLSDPGGPPERQSPSICDSPLLPRCPRPEDMRRWRTWPRIISGSVHQCPDFFCECKFPAKTMVIRGLKGNS